MSTADPNPVKSDPQSPDPKTTEGVSDSSTENPKANPNKPISESAGEDVEGNEDGDEDEEEEECGFCLFMKGGGCKDAFTVWENCVKEAEAKEEDYVEKCTAVTVAMKECMAAHADYYGPILRVEEAAEEKALKDLEKEKEAERSGQATGPSDSEANVASKDLRPESGGGQ